MELLRWRIITSGIRQVDRRRGRKGREEVRVRFPQAEMNLREEGVVHFCLSLSLGNYTRRGGVKEDEEGASHKTIPTLLLACPDFYCSVLTLPLSCPLCRDRGWVL